MPDMERSNLVRSNSADPATTTKVKEQIKVNLIQARNAALSYLDGFDFDELGIVINVAEEELDESDTDI